MSNDTEITKEQLFKEFQEWLYVKYGQYSDEHLMFKRLFPKYLEEEKKK